MSSDTLAHTPAAPGIPAASDSVPRGTEAAR